MADFQDASDFLDLVKKSNETARSSIDAAMTDVLKHGATVITQQAAQIVQDIAQDKAFSQ